MCDFIENCMGLLVSQLVPGLKMYFFLTLELIPYFKKFHLLLTSANAKYYLVYCLMYYHIPLY